MTDDNDFSPAEQAQWDAMKADAPAPAPEPVPAAAPAPEPAAAVTPPPPPEPKPAATTDRHEPETVPLPVLLETRRELNALKRQMEALQPKPTPQQQAAIDPENLTVDTVKTMAQRMLEMEQERARQSELGYIATFGQQHAVEFKKTTPDFEDAYAFLRNGRAEQHFADGMPPQEIAQQLMQEEADILRMCARMRVNPAAFVYGLAQSAGYQKAAPAADPAAPALTAVPAASPTPARDEKGQFVKADAKTKVEMAAKGHEQATNPVATVGAGQGGPLDLRALAALDGDEFDKATSGKNWAKLWGNG